MEKRSGSTGSEPGPIVSTCGLGPLTLYCVVAVGGAAVMAIEVLGTRIIAPYFGASLVVWAAMISVTLSSLAVGYWVGGSLSVRGAGRWTLCLLLGAPAIWLILVSWSSSPVLQWSDGLGLRAGVLISAVVLFGVPLASLGTLPPIVIGLANDGPSGRFAGRALAVSTLAGVASTLAVAFWLLPLMPIGRILAGVGAMLLLCAIAAIRPRLKWRSTGVLCLCCSATLLGLLRPIHLPTTASWRVVARMEAAVGRIQVVENLDERWFMIDCVAQGAIDRETGTPLLEYAHMMATLPLVRPQGRRCLMLGLGAGAVPFLFTGSGVLVDVVEIDPGVVELARRYFGPLSTSRVIIGDARVYLNRNQDRYDFIVVDIFNGGMVQSHLLSTEAVNAYRNSLVPGGIVAVNVVDGAIESFPASARIAATLRRSFRHVEAYTSTPGEEVANVVFFCSDAAVGLDVHIDLTRLSPTTARVVARMPGRKLVPAADDSPLTDGWNPLDAVQARTAERVRQGMLRKFGEELMSR